MVLDMFKAEVYRLDGWNSVEQCHSFIYFAFCKSIQGFKQPKGYRTCHIANNIHIEWVYDRVHLNTKPTKIQV